MNMITPSPPPFHQTYINRHITTDAQGAAGMDTKMEPGTLVCLFVCSF
jgi:hypothetical protein